MLKNDVNFSNLPSSNTVNVNFNESSALSKNNVNPYIYIGSLFKSFTSGFNGTGLGQTYNLILQNFNVKDYGFSKHLNPNCKLWTESFVEGAQLLIMTGPFNSPVKIVMNKFKFDTRYRIDSKEFISFLKLLFSLVLLTFVFIYTWVFISINYPVLLGNTLLLTNNTLLVFLLTLSYSGYFPVVVHP